MSLPLLAIATIETAILEYQPTPIFKPYLNDNIASWLLQYGIPYRVEETRRYYIDRFIYLLTLRTAEPRCACGQGCDSGGQSQLTMAAVAAAAGRVRRTLISTGCTGHGCTWQPQTIVWGPPPELPRDLRPPPPRLARWSTCNWHGCTGQPQRAAAPRRPAPCTRLHTRSIQRPACD